MRNLPARSILLAAIAAAFVFVSCSPAAPPGNTGDESLLPGDEVPATAPGGPGSSSPPGARASRPGDGPSTPTTTVVPSGPNAPAYVDAGGVGAMARAYLKASPATRLIVEVDYVAGRAPSPAALDHLAQVLRREARKPDGVSVVRSDEISPTRSRYSFEDIEALEREHRDHRSSGATATMYLLYLNGELADEEGALGVAYRASAAAIFIDRIRSAASTLVQPGAIERAVVVHEAGHLLALLNIGYQSRSDHEDPQNPHHSRYRDSVMYWAVEDISVASLLSGGPPDDFDRFDRDDLELLRTT